VGLSRPDRELIRRVDDVHADVAVAAARVEGAAFVTDLALSHAGRLTMHEHRLYRFAPTGEHRYAAIAEAFTATASMEIFGLAARSRFS
jgi:hypothetical protein